MAKVGERRKELGRLLDSLTNRLVLRVTVYGQVNWDYARAKRDTIRKIEALFGARTMPRKGGRKPTR